MANVTFESVFTPCFHYKVISTAADQGSKVTAPLIVTAHLVSPKVAALLSVTQKLLTP